MSTSRSGRPAQMRPSRAEREPYTDALAQAVAEGRLTDALYEERVDEVERASTFGRLDELVADTPFTPAVPERTYARLRTGRVVLTGLFVGLVAGVVTHMVVAVPAPTEAGSTAVIAEEGGEAEGGGAPAGWQGPEVATEFDSLDPLDDGAIEYALEVAQSAGLTQIEEIRLDPDSSGIEGVREDGTIYSVSLGPDTVGSMQMVDAEVDEDAIFIYPDVLDHGLDAYVEAGRDAADVGDDVEVGWVRVISGDEWYTPDSAGRSVVRIDFEDGSYGEVHGDDLTPVR